MKFTGRIICILLCAALLALSCGWAREEATDHVAEAGAVLDQMLGGDFAAVTARFDDSIAGQITPEALGEAWQGQVASLGEFAGIGDSTTVDRDGEVLVRLLVEFDAGGIILNCVFNETMKLTGLYMEPVPESEAAVQGIEVPLPEGASESEVKLFEGEDNELNGALVLPADYGDNTPAVVFAHGSGATDMDETIGPNKPFRDIAYGLAEKGIASIRYDKMIYAHPELAALPDANIDTEYTEAVLEALDTIKNVEGIGDVYLIGHSQGGMLTPYLIRKSGDGGFAGGVIMAGSPRQLWEISLSQNRALIELLPEDQRDAANQQLDAEIARAEQLQDMTDEQAMEEVVFGASAYYLKHMGGISEIGAALESGGLSLLIMQGENDVQVSMEEDFAAWRNALEGEGDFTFISYPGLNHLFMAGEGTIADAMQSYQQPAVVDSAVINDIAEWILKLT